MKLKDVARRQSWRGLLARTTPTSNLVKPPLMGTTAANPARQSWTSPKGGKASVSVVLKDDVFKPRARISLRKFFSKDRSPAVLSGEEPLGKPSRIDGG